MSDRLFVTMAERHQYLPELTRFCELLQDRGVRRYLEIGSKFGASLWAVGNALPKGSLLVAVDLPGKDVAKASLIQCSNELKKAGQTVDLIFGDSTDPKVIEQVRVKYGLFDCVFIDANHTTPFVLKDWGNYGPMARMVAFHDISWKRAPTWVGTPINVPEFWRDLRETLPFVEIALDPSEKNNGIGVVFQA